MKKIYKKFLLSGIILSLVLSMNIVTNASTRVDSTRTDDNGDPYNGWVQIDNRQYYYEDGELHSKTGVDVSAYQEQIDWNAVKNDDVEFAIIRIGYGDDCTSQDDAYANYNMDECERIGLPYGVYIYSYAQDNDNVQSEIAHTVRMLKGRNPEIGVWFDSEENSSLAVAGASALNRFADTFLETMQNENGYKVGLYASKYWLTSILTSDVLRQYDTWVAQYYNTLTYAGDYKIWQYASDGDVAGISGRVDMNAMICDESINERMDYFESAANTDIENYVRTDYLEYLGRTADESGLEAYSAKLMSTGDYESIDDSLKSSDEYKRHVCKTVSEGLYYSVLGRNADESGLDAQTNYLMCQDMDAIVNLVDNMEESSEYRDTKKENFIQNCYKFYLNRNASEGEIDAWMNTNLLRDIHYGIYYSQEALNIRN